MNDRIETFDMIGKAIKATKDSLSSINATNNLTIIEEAQENYLQAFAHAVKIDEQYIKKAINRF